MEYKILFLLSLILCTNCLPLEKRDQVAPCANVYAECPEWKNAGFCEQNRDYMLSTCPVTCGFCKEADVNMEAYSSQNQQNQDAAVYQQATQTAQHQPPAQNTAAPAQNNAATQTSQVYDSQNLQHQSSPNASSTTAQPNATQPKGNDNEKASSEVTGKAAKSAKPASKEKTVKDLKSESNMDESDTQDDEEPATNEQTHPSSKHIENENSLYDKNDGKSEKVKTHISVERIKSSASSGSSGSGIGLINDENVDLNRNEDQGFNSNDFLIEDKTNKLKDAKGTFDTVKRFNDNMRFSSETTDEAVAEEEESSGDAAEEISGSGNEEYSGTKKTEEGSKEENVKNNENEKDKNKNKGGQAAEEERTENAEKYEDEEEKNEKGVKPVQQRSHQKKKNLMEKMLDNGELKAVSVSKGKQRTKVPVHHHKEEEGGDDEDDEDATDIDLDFKETGLEHFSGSGGEDDKMHVTLRQNFDKKYEDQNSAAYKILSGNFEKDMTEALGDESAITDVSFSEAEVEGNPRTTGKVRVNFKFDGDYKKLQKLIGSGSINGLLVIKNSLEGPMLNLDESE